MQSILDKIRNFKFPFSIIRRNAYLEFSNLYSEVLKARLEKDVLVQRNLEQQEEIDVLMSRLDKDDWDIVADMPDPSPKDTDHYKSYVSEVAGFHTRILSGKMRHAISMAYKLLEDSSDQSVNERIKGSVYAFREIMRWGESNVNKRMDFESNDETESDDSVLHSSKIISDILEDN